MRKAQREIALASEAPDEGMLDADVLLVRQLQCGDAEAGHRFDVVYLDPPYASDLYEPLLGEAGPLLAEGGVVVAEHFHKRALPETIGPFVRTRSVRVGDHRLTFYRRHDPGTP